MYKTILIVPGFMADTYTQIEESFIDLCKDAPQNLRFVWMIRSLSNKYTEFKDPGNRKKLTLPYYATYLKKLNIEYFFENISKYNIFRNYFLFLNVFKKYEIEAVYSHFRFDRYYVAFFGKLFGKKTIWNEHMFWNEPGTRLIGLKKLFFKFFVDYFISVSDFITSTLPKRSRIFTIKNSIKVDPDNFDKRENPDKIKEKLDLDRNKKVILMVSAFRPQKRYDLALKICKKVLEDRKDVIFVFLGDGPLKEKFEKNILNVGIHNSILAPGHVRNVDDYYQAADVCMLSSTDEPFGYTVLEALKFSRPIVAFDTGGPKEILIHEKTGLLVPKENVRLFAEKIIELLNNPNKGKLLGSNGHEDLKARFSRKAWKKTMYETFHEILQD